MLVLLNGPPASGKSTIAGRLITQRPLALNLDVDVIRSLLGDWKARPADAGIAARRLAVAMALGHLASGNDVIVPQFLARAEFIEQLAETTATVGARFVEIALILSRADAVAAFRRRSAQPATAAHRDAAEAVDAAGGIERAGGDVRRLHDVAAGARIRTARRGDDRRHRRNRGQGGVGHRQRLTGQNRVGFVRGRGRNERPVRSATAREG